jgi:hypothetical protein
MNNSFLLENEKFEPEKTEKKSRENVSDAQINDKYRKGEMRIVTEQGRINLDSIVTLLESKQNGKSKYILNPEYQRRKRWTNQQKSLLIESFIINVPIPPISVYEVMDGLQRLTAIYDFYKERFALEGLEYWQELEGRKYSQLPENVKAGIDRRYLSSIILLEETAKNKAEAENLKQIVFERLNSGGEKLTPQETRNALYSGHFNQMCVKSAENKCFRKMWNFPLEEEVEDLLLKSEDELKETSYTFNNIKSYRRMDDVELVLRFFAYRHIDKLTSPVEKFLDNYLKQANKYEQVLIDELQSLFIETVELIHDVLGVEAFVLPKKEDTQEYKSPTKTIYDSIMQAFANNIKHKTILLKKKDIVKSKLYQDVDALNRTDKDKNNYLFDGRYNNSKDVIKRIEYFDGFLKKIIQNIE